MTNDPKMGTIVPKMGTTENEKLSSALFGKVRRAVLGLFFFRKNESFYLRQITRIIDMGQGAVQRELKGLTAAGIITRLGLGHKVRYQVNQDCPIFKELESLMAKTAGLADVLREAIEPLANQIKIAFIYGSQASRTARASSDVDLLIVGDVDELEIHRAIIQGEKHLARQVNYTFLNQSEFKLRCKEKDGFLERVMKGEKIFIIGGPEDV